VKVNLEKQKRELISGKSEAGKIKHVGKVT